MFSSHSEITPILASYLITVADVDSVYLIPLAEINSFLEMLEESDREEEEESNRLDKMAERYEAESSMEAGE